MDGSRKKAHLRLAVIFPRKTSYSLLTINWVFPPSINVKRHMLLSILKAILVLKMTISVIVLSLAHSLG